MINRFATIARRNLRPLKHWFDYAALPSSRPASLSQNLGESVLTVTAADPGGLGDAAMIKAITDHYGADNIDATVWGDVACPSYDSIKKKVPVSLLSG